MFYKYSKKYFQVSCIFFNLEVKYEIQIDLHRKSSENLQHKEISLVIFVYIKNKKNI